MWKSILLISVSFAAATADESPELALPAVPCRLYFDFYYVAAGNAHVCLIDIFRPELQHRYRIDSELNEKVEAIDLRNYKIFHIPSYLSRVFPNVRVYAATANALKEVGPENFEGLSKLQALYLSHNQLQEIPAGTFANLESLEHLHLQYNKIKYINPTALVGLPKLNQVHADHNVCIDQKFLKEDAYEQFVDAVKELCNDEKVLESDETGKDEL